MATIITKTIGQDGWQDFSTIQGATDAITTSDVANTADLVAADKAVVFEIYAGTYTEDININEGLTCDATRNVTYKPAAGSEHGGVEGAGVVLTNSSGRTLQVSDKHVHLEGIEIRGSSDRTIFLNRTKGTVIDSCIIVGESGCNALFAYGIEDAESDVIQNCRISAVNDFPVRVYNDSTFVPAKTILNNNTIIETNSFCFRVRTTGAGVSVKAELNNNLCFGSVLDNLVVGTNVITGVDNVGGPTSPVPLAQRAEGQTWTFNTDTTAASTGNQVIYEDTNYSLVNVSGNDAVGVGDGTVAPATDINGEDRVRGAASEYADPGAFTTDLITATRTIGKDGWQDFTTFTNAEGGVVGIANDLLGGTRENLAQRNGSIVFDAYKGTYNEIVTLESSLTADATRTVTYKPAAGSEHGGVLGAGVNIENSIATYGTVVAVRDSFVVLEGLCVQATNDITGARTALDIMPNGSDLEGIRLRGLILSTGGFRQTLGAFAGYSFGSVNAPLVVENCALHRASVGTAVSLPVNGTDVSYADFSNTTCAGVVAGSRFFNTFVDTNASINVSLVNCLNLLSNSIREQGAGSKIFTGSDNIGGGNEPFPTALQAEGQTWTFTTDTTASSTGNQVIYTSATGALVNVSGNDAVGVGDGTVASTTDINGEDRIRGAANEYADPGAFTTDLITATRTIGKDGWQDFSTFTAAEANVVTTANELLGGTRENLAQRNGSIVFEAYAGTYTERMNAVSTLTSDATRNVTYKAAAGSEHGGSAGAGVLIDTTGPSPAIKLTDDFAVVDGFSITTTATYCAWLDGAGVVVRNCIVSATNRGILIYGGTATEPVEVRNCVVTGGSGHAYLVLGGGPISPDTHARVVNCTGSSTGTDTYRTQATGAGTSTTAEYINCVSLGNLTHQKIGSFATATGSNNVGGTANRWPEGTRAESQIWTFTTDTNASSTGSQVIYDDTTGALVNVSGNDAVGVGDGTQAPTTDINGNDRIRGASNEYADPGAFSTDLITATKIIDVNEGFPYDYSGFIEAEDDVEEVAHELLGGSRENLAQRNGSIVFEARAGTYLGYLVSNNPLILDQIRNITYKAAAGSEHGGSSSAGVILDANGGSRVVMVDDDFIRLEGLVFVGGISYSVWLQGKGIVAHNCIAAPINRGFLAYDGTPTYPIVLENCVSRGGPSYSFLVLSPPGGETHGRLINCVGETTTTTDTFRTQKNSGSPCSAEYINCLSLGSNTHQTVGGATVTGSNNVGGTLNRWPEAIRANSQIWTLSTDTTAASTGNQVIYDDSTGALVNVSGNDAVGVGTGTGAPTTDILGKSRIRGADNEYADPGAFTTDLITATKIIDVNQGPGYDFSGFVDAENDVDEVAHELLGGTRENLAQRNGSILFEARAGIYPQTNLLIDSTITADPSRNVTYKGTGDVTLSSDGGTLLNSDDFTVLDGIDINSTAAAFNNNGRQAVLKNCTVAAGTHAVICSHGASLTCDNVLIDANNYSFYAANNTDSTTTLTLRNCTVIRAQSAVPIRLQSFNPKGIINASIDNCLLLDTASQYYDSGDPGTIRLSGGGNVGGPGTAFPSGLRAEGQTWTFSTSATAPSTGNQVIYTSATGAMLNVSGNDAIGVGDGTKAPTTDINGTNRIRGLNDDYADPGAYTTDKITILKRVANLGYGISDGYYDYGSLKDVKDNVLDDARDALSDNQSRLNLAQRNYELVYEFEKGDYTGPDNRAVSINPGPLVFGPTNRLILRANEQSHHGGDFNKGVRIFGTGYGELVTFYPANPNAVLFADWEGFVTQIDDANTNGRINVVNYRNSLGAAYCGGRVRNCLDRSTHTNSNMDRAFVKQSDRTSGSSKYPIEVENNVSIRPGGCIFFLPAVEEESKVYIKATNNTFISRWVLGRTNYYDRSYPTHCELELNNNILLPSNEIAGGHNQHFFIETVTQTSATDFFDGTTILKGENNYSFEGTVNDYDAGNGRQYTSVQIPTYLRGSVYPVNYTTDITSTSADTFIYDADNLSPINTSGNALIGLGDSSLAPSADILSASRIRPSFGAAEIGPDYSEPGAFSTELSTITKTIGSDGDFSGFGQAESALFNDTSIIYERNLSKANLAVVVEVEAGRYTEHLYTYNANFYGGPTNTVTYRAAAGSEHNGLVDSGVRLGRDAGTYSWGAANISLPFQILEGLVLLSNGTNYANSVVTIAEVNRRAEGNKIKNCIFSCSENIDGYGARLDCYTTDRPRGTEEYPIVFDNCVFLKPGIQTTRIGSGADANVQFNNCTFGEGRTQGRVAANVVGGGKTYKVSFTNCIRLADGGDINYTPGSDTTFVAGPSNLSLHTGNSDNYWPESLTYTATTDTSAASTGNRMIYDASTLALVNVSGNDAIGVGTGSAINVPVTDILGNSRIRGASNEYADPGAFSVDNITYTRTIGSGGSANGFDYGNFTDAEAEVTIIPYAENLAQRNLAIVFEADAGDYSENLDFDTNGGLTCDPTRNVTWKNGLGSEHGGQFGSGANIVGYFIVRESFAVVDGLSVSPPNGGAAAIFGPPVGVSFRNMMAHSTDGYAFRLNEGATAAFPGVVENCVGKSDTTTPFDIRSQGSGLDAHWSVVNCTAMATGIKQGFRAGLSSSDTLHLNLVNNVVNGGTSRSYYGFAGPTIVVTGSNNVGPDDGSAPFPAALQAEGQTWTTTTDTTQPSTGNQVIYTSATGALVNVSGNDAVGVGTTVSVPTTDILGNSRLRGANNEYTDPGAFSTDLVTFNKKIGPYREYTTFTDAEADVVAISTDGNLAQRNEAIVFEADAGTYSEKTTFNSSLTTDATHNVTYKAGAGSEHGGVQSAGVLISSSGINGVRDDYTTFEGLEVVGSASQVFNIQACTGVTIRNCIIDAATIGMALGDVVDLLVENCVFPAAGYAAINPQFSSGTGSYNIRNCTFSQTGGTAIRVIQTGTVVITIDLINNLRVGTGGCYLATGDLTKVTATGSNNVGGSTQPYPSSTQAESQTWTFTTDTTASSTGNQVVYEADTWKMLAVSGNDAIGIATVSAAPTTDINGTSRLRGVGTQYVDPGAFTSDVNTITKTIGIGGAVSGFDFGGFLDAEAAVTTSAVTYDTNLAKKNIAIVFEANAGTYLESVAFQSDLISDATRNVTYKAGAGSEHGGVFGAGAHITSNGFTINAQATEKFTRFEGLSVNTSAAYATILRGEGQTVASCLVESTGAGGTAVFATGAASVTNPVVVENSVLKAPRGLYVFAGAADSFVEANNNTLISQTTGSYAIQTVQGVGYSPTLSMDNMLVITLNGSFTFAGAGAITGSNNVGGAGGPLPAAIQAEGQTWTFTTDTTQPSTGNQVIYTSATGALVNVSGNDAIGVGTGSAINVPANDILGKSRLRGLSNEYADPGAFTTDIETTTLTANPGTLSSLITNLTPYITTTNIAKRNESIVIELEKADYPELYYINVQSIIGDTVRNITIKPQEGAHHKGIRGAGIRFISANTGSDNVFLKDVSGFTIEGVEIYKPSGDIGRHGTVVRDSEGVQFKDVIFNDLEVSSHTQTMMGSTYRNGFLSPISFKNCLGFCRSLNFYFQSAGALPGGKYELINCTLSSVSNTIPVIKADSTQADGTIEINLVNNLILSPHRNININKTNGGDGVVYGSNNTGPNTPNYQLPTAVRASIYPILPTTDYTPLPVEPAAVYKPTTLQLLDITYNDAIGLGIGTEDPNVPAEGIGGESRSTSSCNPGCWEEQYDLVDLELNTTRGVEGFRNIFVGPNTDFAHVVLPDDTVPVFIVVGDSTAQGFSNTPADNLYKDTTTYWPDDAFDGSAIGYFWDKYMNTIDGGVTWTRPYPDFINTNTSGTGFVPMNPRMGGVGAGTFTYADQVGVPSQVGGCSPIWDFALDISGLFRNSSGEPLVPHFIFIAATGSRLGSDGPTGPGTTEFNFSPSGGYLYNTLIEGYVKPAVDDIMNRAKNPLLVGSLVMHGGTEAKIDYNPNPNGNKVSASGLDTYTTFLRGLQQDTKVNGSWPYMFYTVWNTLPSGSTAQSDYPVQYTDTMRRALRDLQNVHINRLVPLEELFRDKTENGDPSVDGIHFLQDQYHLYGKRFGEQYKSLLAMNKYPLYGRTLSQIFDEE